MSVSNSKAIDFLIKKEKFIFYSILLINLAFLFFTRFYPTMDGPAHLYNSNLIKQLLFNNRFISEFYQINNVAIPNWTSHFLLACFRVFLPAWLCEKLLIVIYVSGMALSFRYMIMALKPRNIALSVLIFPFIYSFLFHLGFYNYSLSFIFLFITIAYWISNYKSNSLSLYLVSGILFICTYFSNVLTYAFLGISIGCIILFLEAESNPIFSKKYFLAILSRLKGLMLCALPSLLLLFWFFFAVSMPGSTQKHSVNDLIKWLNDVRSLIVYGYDDVVYTEHFFHLLLFLLILSYILNNNRFSLKEKISDASRLIAYIPLFLALILLFVLPDGSSAGMMSDRLNLMFFIFFIILVVSQTLPPRVLSISSIIIICLHFALLGKHRNTIHDLNTHVKMINEASKHIEENSVVLPVNLSENWLEIHFSNYLGIDKPLVILENYEANVGWFPIKWNSNAPTILLGDKNSVDGLSWFHSTNPEIRQIDYIFIYGTLAKIQDNNMKELTEALSSGFTLEYESTEKNIQVYKRNL